MSLDKYNALICGASRGNGLALISLLIDSQEYKKIIAISRSGSVSEEVCDLAKSKGVELICYSCDVCDPVAVSGLSIKIQTHTTHIHLLVNTVGFLWNEEYSPEKNIRSLSLEQLQLSIALNTWPAMNLVQHLMPLFRHKNHCRMVFYSARVGSISDNGLGGWYSYRISKAALNMAVRTMAIELGRRNPNLCCFTYHPGTVDTELSRPFTSRYTKNTIFSIEEAANYLLGVLQQSTPEHNGLLFDWNGDIIPF